MAVQPMEMNESPVIDKPAPSGQDMDAAKDVKLVLTLFDQAKKARAEFDADWNKREEFYKGKQWDKKRASYKSKPVMNVIRSTIQTIMPILTDAKPGFNLLPQEPRDFMFAETMGKVTEHWWEKPAVSMDLTLVEALEDSQIFDAGIMKVTWDAEMEDGAGDVRVKVVSPKDIFVPADAIDFDKNCPYVIERMYKTVGELKRKFPKMAKFIKPDDSKDDNDKSEGINDEVVLVSPTDRRSTRSDQFPVAHEDDRKTAMVYECWMDDETVDEVELEEDFDTGERDGDGRKVMGKRRVQGFKKRFPRGRVITILPNQKLRLVSEDNPYEHGLKPYVRFVDTMRARRFWCEGEAEPLMDIQRVINKILANILDYMNFMGNPIWVVEKGSGVNPNRLTNQTGLVVITNEGKKDAVKREIPPALPAYIFEFYNTMLRMAEMVSGANDVTQGRRPKGVTAAEAISELQEASQTRIRLKERNLQVSLSKLGDQVVKLMMQFYTGTRVAKISGPNSDFPEFFEYFIDNTEEGKRINRRKIGINPDTQEAIVPNEFQTSQPTRGMFDVKVLTGTSLPHAKAQRSNLALRLFENAGIDQQNLLETLEWPDAENVVKRMQEQAQAMAEAQEQEVG